MTDAVLTVNAGSSSLKFALFGATGDLPLASGMADRIGDGGTLRLRDAAGTALPVASGGLGTYAEALGTALDSLSAALPEVSVAAVGHRVVHGGPDMAAPALIDAALIDRIAALVPLAPLHQPHNLAGILAARAAFPDCPQVACFDTAFHRAHPWVNDTYALPRAFYDRGLRRYGFHGLSYDYANGHIAQTYPDLSRGRIVVAHLGNGASLCAISGGRPVATTMGFSALDGLAMGTRCGQIDPGVLLYLMTQEGMGADQISDLLYRRSGLLGLSGLSNDMRTLEASDDPRAVEAISYFVARLQREIGAMAASMGGIDALAFSGGIGENSARIRAETCAALGFLGIVLDGAANAGNAPVISARAAGTAVLVVPTNEELVIARATLGLTGLGADRP